MSTILKPISNAKAERVFREFKKHYEEKGYDLSEARLILDWHDGGHPAIVWEGNAPSNWAINWFNRQTVKGTFCEPYYSFVLCIYPEY
jgi:hypothetical protein